MNKEFKYESEHYGPNESLNAVLEVEINIEAHAEDDAEFCIESVFDTNAQCFREFESLPKNEQLEIEEKAQMITDQHGYDAWLEDQQSRADMLYDSWKEGN